CVKLDATPLGQPVYERFGFQAEMSLTRWESQQRRSAPGQPEGFSQPVDGDLERIVALDALAFGCPRPQLLAELVQQSFSTLIYPAASSEEFAFGILRRGARAFYLGPVVAQSTAGARAVILGLLGRIPDQPVFWDIIDANSAAASWAQEFGFR